MSTSLTAAPDPAPATLSEPLAASDALLKAARAEAAAVGSLYLTTRDLLVALLQQPPAHLRATLERQPVDVDCLRQMAVQIYERPEQSKPKSTPTTRRRFGISPLFLGLLAGLIASGAYLYYAAEPNPAAIFPFILCGWIVSLSLHEFGHALAAYFGGDRSVVDQGYLTLNPLKYTHLLISIVMPIFILLMGGIGLPGGAVYIDRSAIRNRSMHSVVSAAGPVANLLCAMLLAIPFFINGPNSFDWVLHLDFYGALAFLVLLQVSAILLNLLPIPGLDGFGIIAPWLPDSVLQTLAPFYSYGFMILLFLFFFFEPFPNWFWSEVFNIVELFQIDPALVSYGYDMFTFWN